jgi:4-hydroxybenzoate polyprenyltransferase
LKTQKDMIFFSKRPADIGRALRLHQWLKNLLIAVPSVAHHNFTLEAAKTLFLAFLAYSLCASAAYTINDVLDREHDRKHPRKKARPFASGTLTPVFGCVLAACLSIAAFAICLDLPKMFVLVLSGYFVLTLAYSSYIKRLLMMDVVVLACLYGLRVVAGGVAVNVPLSQWLIAFCVFFFLCLALVKRLAELEMATTEQDTQVSGRGYRSEDWHALQSLAGAAGFVSVLILFLYLNSDAVNALYRQPLMLWGVGPILIYWIGRIVLIAGRGEMQEDPVIFAATDKASLIAGALIVVTLILSI